MSSLTRSFTCTADIRIHLYAGTQPKSEATLPQENKAKFTEPVSFREDKRILEIVDGAAAARGCNRTAIYREAIRQFLASLGLLDEETMKLLGGTR